MINEDPELLSLMLMDSQSAQKLYQTTNYWKVMERKFLPEIKRYGLTDFRRRQRSALSSFGATDLLPTPPRFRWEKFRLLNNRYTYQIPGYEASIEKLAIRLGSLLNLNVVGYPTISQLEHLAFDRAENFGERFGAKSIRSFEISDVGNPEWIFEIHGNSYTINAIDRYLYYAWCCQFINFDNISIIVELGSGMGLQAEVFKKLFPEKTILLFDIPPQIYVCQQYLSSVFPGDVVSYRETRDYVSVNSLEPGKIYIFGNWKFPIVDKIPGSLFWNCASFQEMEPNVVMNYLSYVNNFAEYAFIFNAIKGKEVAPREDAPGVLKQTTFKHFEEGLSNFVCMNKSGWVSALATEVNKNFVYANSVWKRRANSGSVTVSIINSSAN